MVSAAILDSIQAELKTTATHKNVFSKTSFSQRFRKTNNTGDRRKMQFCRVERALKFQAIMLQNDKHE